MALIRHHSALIRTELQNYKNNSTSTEKRIMLVLLYDDDDG